MKPSEFNEKFVVGSRISINWDSRYITDDLTIGAPMRVEFSGWYWDLTDNQWVHSNRLQMYFDKTDYYNQIGTNPSCIPSVYDVENGYEITDSDRELILRGEITSLLYVSQTLLDNFIADILGDTPQSYIDYYRTLMVYTDLVVLYKFYGENDYIDKSGSLTIYNVYGGNYKGEVDRINPSIIVENNTAHIEHILLRANYMYIESMERFYYIENIINVRDNIYRIQGHVDVLYTYKDDILSQKNVLITRAESFEQGYEDNPSDCPDERYPLDADYSVDYNSAKVDTTTGNLVNTTFKVNGFENTDETFIACLINDKVILSPVNTQAVGNLPSIQSMRFESPMTCIYRLNASDMRKLVVKVKDSSSLATYVACLLSLPFVPDDSMTQTEFKINDQYVDDGDTQTLRNRIYNGFSKYFVIADFTYTPMFSGDQYWRNYEPYSMHEIFVPYYGWVQLQAKDILDKRILVYYMVNYQTGSAQVFIVQYGSTPRPLWTSTCQLGTLIPINTTNNQENEVARRENTTNLALGLIGGGISTGVGIAKGSPLSVVGGVLSTAKTIANAINSEQAIFERTTAIMSSGNSSLYTSQAVITKTSYREELDFIDSTAFIKLNGKKCNLYADMDDVDGYREVGYLHYKPSYSYSYILKPEIEEIESLLRDGVVYYKPTP